MPFPRLLKPAMLAVTVALLMVATPPSRAQTIPEAELMKAGPLGDEVMGSDKAPVTIIEYASLTYPHCAHFAEATFPEIKKKYIDTGKVRYILRDFPLDTVAAGASMLARCAPKNENFPMIALFFRAQDQWAVAKPLPHLLSIAKQVGFAEKSAKACLSNQNVLNAIEWVRDRAYKKLKVNATPTFFINGKKYTGDMSIGDVQKAIQPYLTS
jgi:protein-disulfide isomerase